MKYIVYIQRERESFALIFWMKIDLKGPPISVYESIAISFSIHPSIFTFIYSSPIYPSKPFIYSFILPFHSSSVYIFDSNILFLIRNKNEIIFILTLVLYTNTHKIHGIDFIFLFKVKRTLCLCLELNFVLFTEKKTFLKCWTQSEGV